MQQQQQRTRPLDRLRQVLAQAQQLSSLPTELATLDDAPHVATRTTRDWAADIGLFVLAVTFWVNEVRQFPPSYADGQDAWLTAIDPWVGMLACCALWARRRFPVALGVVMLVLLVLAGTATVAALITILTVAIHRPWRTAALVTTPYLLIVVPYGYVEPEPGLNPLTSAVAIAALFGAPLAVGVAIRSRRQLVVSLHRDAERERREHLWRLADARRTERTRIAHEMHDVLAHRISLLSVHAGALAYRAEQATNGTGPALADTEIVDTVGVIHEAARQAVSDLSTVLSVLRSDDPEHEERPQPRLADIAELADDARSAGQDVTVTGPPDGAESLPAQLQRTAYRVVQEALTNARKHAPNVPVDVELVGEPGAALTITVGNPLPETTTAAAPGAQVGLTGLAERVSLDGGTLEHTATGGRFRLAATLPWPT